MKKLFVIVDMQNDFVYGSLGSAEAVAVVPAVRELLTRARADGTEIVFTMDTHGEDYPNTSEGKHLPVSHCVKGTKGWEIIPELADFADHRFEKNVFGSLGLARYAEESAFEEIALCGVCTDICVIANALLLKTFCPETPLKIYSRACAGTTPEAHKAALLAMKSCQAEIL